jgi:cystathionine beta-lyase/cystathionine gamma-synthase
MGARTGRECVFIPSGRFAIHLAFQLLLSPGDRILMSHTIRSAFLTWSGRITYA